MTASLPRARTHDRPPLGGPTLAASVRPEPLLGRLLALLELRPDDLLVQLGCAFPDQLLSLTASLRYQALIVDPSPERLAPFVGMRNLRPVVMDPLRFAAYPMQCDRILLEDTLLRGHAGAELAQGLFTRLSPEGRLLAVAPQPAFPAREESRAPAALPRTHAEDIGRTLERAGFEVKRDAAHLGSGHIDLFLGVKAALNANSSP